MLFPISALSPPSHERLRNHPEALLDLIGRADHDASSAKDRDYLKRRFTISSLHRGRSHLWLTSGLTGSATQFSVLPSVCHYLVKTPCVTRPCGVTVASLPDDRCQAPLQPHSGGFRWPSCTVPGPVAMESDPSTRIDQVVPGRAHMWDIFCMRLGERF